jgi:hypothetical protein
VYEGWQVVVGPVSRRPVVFRNGSGERVSVLAEGTEPIDPELVAKARRTLSGYAPKPGGPVNPLKGLTVCAGCGGGLPRNGAKFICAKYSKGALCPAPTVVLATALELYVREAWVTRLSTADPEDPLLAEVAERYAALSRPSGVDGYQEAQAALRSAEAGVQRLAKQQADGLFDPPFDVHLPALQREARAALSAAQSAVAAFTQQRVDISFLLDHETATETIEGASLETRRDLLSVAIRRIWVTKAEGASRKPFDGRSRVRFEWHGDTPERGGQQ